MACKKEDYSDNPLRGKNGAYLTQGLFYEYNRGGGSSNNEPIWTLRPEDFKGYPSLYQIYMASVDEYDFVMKTFGNMSHFRKLCELDWFMEGHQFAQGTRLDGLRHWREDMRLRDESIAKKQLAEEAKNGNVTAMKALHETAKKANTGTIKESRSQNPNKKGRPSKDKPQEASVALKAFQNLKKRTEDKDGKLDA